jgi:hypothetical protein
VTYFIPPSSLLNKNASSGLCKNLGIGRRYFLSSNHGFITGEKHREKLNDQYQRHPGQQLMNQTAARLSYNDQCQR